MTKAEFLRALAGELSRLPESERREHLDYYSELIDDMMEEDGLSEQEAVDRLDDVYAIAADILRQRAPEGGAKPAAPGKKRGALIAAVSAAAVLKRRTPTSPAQRPRRAGSSSGRALTT